MNIKKLYINSKVYVKALGRKVEVNEKNTELLLQHGFNHLFTKPKKKKDDSKDKSGTSEHNSSNSNRETNS